jgi:hypothetical protein
LKKRRSTVLVSPGKDVTLYIPSDTPPQVINYMNRLKADGVFSQGIMDILTRHILREQPIVTPVKEDGLNVDSGWTYEDPVFIPEPIEEAPEDRKYKIDAASNAQKSFSLDQIFRQAERNAGKLLHETNDKGKV